MEGAQSNMPALDSAPFLLGVNYWPRRKAMSGWSAFDAGEVRDEFDLIAEIGLKLVRVILRPARPRPCGLPGVPS